MRTLLIGLLYAGLTVLYWSAVVIVSYGLFDGSTRPGTPHPTEAYANLTTTATLAISLVIYVLLLVVVHKLVRRYGAGR